MLFALGIAQFAADRFQCGEGAYLVRPYQPRIAGNICGEDRGETGSLGLTGRQTQTIFQEFAMVGTERKT
jgi:hypothetical protein